MKINSVFICRFCLLLTAASLLLPACRKDNSSQHYAVDQAASAMEWKGYLKDGSGNNGTIKVAGELLANDQGQITGGTIRMPLSSLISINLPTDALKHQLVHHLQSPDFFDMVRHPEISFKIKSLSVDKDLPGTYQAQGTLTMLGKTHPVSFPVKVNARANKLEVTGETSINRTDWGMNYAADEKAADGMYVKPGMDVQFKLVALKQP